MDWLTTSVRPPYALLGPWWGVLVTLLLGFGGVMLVRLRYEHKFYLLRWRAFWLGDSIAIGLVYAFFAGRALRDYEASDWYTQRWVYFTLGLLGLALGIFILQEAQRTRFLTWEEVFAPSELWHTCISWPSFAVLIGGSLIPIWTSETSVWNKLGAMLGLALLIVLIGYDTFFNPERSLPGR